MNFKILLLVVVAASLQQRAFAQDGSNKKVSVRCEDQLKKPKESFTLIGTQDATGAVVANGASGNTDVQLIFNPLKPGQGRKIFVTVGGTTLNKELAPGLGSIGWETGYIARKVLQIDFNIKVECYPESMQVIPGPKAVVEEVKTIAADVNKMDAPKAPHTPAVVETRKSKEPDTAPIPPDQINEQGTSSGK